MNSRSTEDRLLEFREQQRARYLMTATRLSIALAKERNFGARELFGASVLVKPDSDEDRRRKEGARFRDELAALRAFVRAVVELDSANGQMCDLGRTFPGDGAKRIRNKETIRISGRAGRQGRSFDDSRNARLVDDFVDVGNRVRDFPAERLSLLVEHYVFGTEAKQLAELAKIDATSVGGRLSQARRALRKALADLIPSQREAEADGERSRPVDKLEARREKVSRFLRKRLDGGDREEAS